MLDQEVLQSTNAWRGADADPTEDTEDGPLAEGTIPTFLPGLAKIRELYEKNKATSVN
jgi:hypothetical protein